MDNRSGAVTLGEQLRKEQQRLGAPIRSLTPQSFQRNSDGNTEATKLYWQRVTSKKLAITGRSAALPPKCAFCNDAGVVKPDIDKPEGSYIFGKLIPCPMCFDKSSQKAYLISRSNIPSAYKSATFENFYYSTESRVIAAPIAQDMAEKRAGWLTLWGCYGSGKSYLAAAAVNYAISLGIEARYWEMAALLDHLRSAYDPNSGPGFSQLFHDICECPVLVIDECDIFKATDWAYAQFRQLVSHRSSNDTRLATIWVLNPEPIPGGNKFPADLDFLASRMSKHKIIAMNDGDVRPL